VQGQERIRSCNCKTNDASQEEKRSDMSTEKQSMQSQKQVKAKVSSTGRPSNSVANKRGLKASSKKGKPKNWLKGFLKCWSRRPRSERRLGKLRAGMEKEKGEGRREKGEGRREKGEGRREKGERRKVARGRNLFQSYL